METTMLSDLHAAKAVEYLLAVLFLATFALFWRYASPRIERHAESAALDEAPNVTRPPLHAAEGWFRVPEGISLHPGHTWAKRVNGGDEVVVGVDDFARAAVGRIEDLSLPAPGAVIRQGVPAWTLRGAAGALPMVAPVDGMVIAANPKARLGAVESDPYGEGWLLRVMAPRFARNARQLLAGSAARAWMDDAAHRLRAVVSPDLGPALADGGVPVAGIAGEVGPEIWKQIAQDFFFVEDGNGGA